MPNKRGVSYSIEALIAVILATGFLIFAIFFSKTIFKTSTDWVDDINNQLKEQALEYCESGNSKIALSRYNFEESTSLPLFIKNLGQDDNFTASIKEASNHGVDADKIFFYRKESIFIKSKECRLAGFKIEIPPDIPKNFYIFDLKIENSEGFYDSRELSLDLQ